MRDILGEHEAGQEMVNRPSLATVRSQHKRVEATLSGRETTQQPHYTLAVTIWFSHSAAKSWTNVLFVSQVTTNKGAYQRGGRVAIHAVEFFLLGGGLSTKTTITMMTAWLEQAVPLSAAWPYFHFAARRDSWNGLKRIHLLKWLSTAMLAYM